MHKLSHNHGLLGTGYPEFFHSLSALRRLLETKDRIDTSKAALATMKIAGKKSWLQAFSTHPALEERIAVLEAGRYQ